MAAMATTGATDPPSSPRVFLLASPGAGHLIPMAELARRLAMTDHGVAPTLVKLTGLSDPATDAAVLSSLPSSVATAVLPAVTTDDLPADTDYGVVMFELMRRSLSHLRDLVVSSTTAAAAIVCDFFGTAALHLAAELGVPGYVFLPNSFSMLSVIRHVAELHDGAASGEYHDLPDPLVLSGCAPLRHDDIPAGFHDRTGQVYSYIVEEARRYGGADGFLVNSFTELEPAAAEAFKLDAEEGLFPPVYPVGPFVRSSSGEKDDDKSACCLEWLDRQQAGTVVYVSFGSGGALSVEQTVELAAGLEMSGHSFLWVVRMPCLDGNPCALGASHGDGNPLAWVPEEFLERTRGRGLAVASWAPQVRVLEHPATAGFVSHCGWNSALESVSAGVPMVAWPLYAEQKMNAAILTEVAGVALRRPAARGDGLVPREEVAAAVRELMGAQKGSVVVRRRARELREAAARAWSQGGPSRRALDEVAGEWRNAAVLRSGNEPSA